MSIIEILTGINSYTFTILFVLFILTFIKKYYFAGILFIRIILAFIMAFFLFEGWETLDYDRYVNNKNEQITFPKNYFIEVCNLKKLYKTNDFYLLRRERSYKYDCDISEAENFLLNFDDNKIIMEIGEVKYIDDTQIFTIVDSFKTDSIGLGASFGQEARFIVLKSNDRSYLLIASNLKYGKLQ